MSVCNLCGGSEFGNMGNRVAVRCKTCGSLERTRMMWMYIRDRVKLGPGSRVLHLAPEPGIYRQISRIVPPRNYICADMSKDRFEFAENFRILDLCRDLAGYESSSFDLILHSHVLEHVRCNVAYVLYQIHRLLKEDGKHVCVIPFAGQYYEESLAKLSPEEATRRFYQHDHVRLFGTRELDMSLGCVIRLPPVFDAEADFGAEALTTYNVPRSTWKGFTPSTVLCLNKRDYLLAL